MHILVKENSILKIKIDELNGKQEDNKKGSEHSWKNKRRSQDVEECTRRNERWEKNIKDWTKKEQESLRKIRENQEYEKKNLAKEVIRVIKQNENIVRDTLNKKKCVIIFGFKKKSAAKEKHTEEEEKRVIKEVFNMVHEESSKIEEELEVIHRQWKCEGGGVRPFKSLVQVSSNSTIYEYMV